ncbi:MAG: hypothetical protein JNG49_00240 [Peptostreptococcus stomatis]|uniref:hypothetical protein n=1 Tax=Peptostreptococcus stomatis TaxID=341694 RepID=UPI001A4F506D|nr:hypothetical protein [Peptostreptococcus stomatis]MBL6464825.1 hypothetical protein [Peptostreptococcus stomatis]
MKKIDKNIIDTDTSNTTNADMENIGKSSIDIDNLDNDTVDKSPINNDYTDKTSSDHEGKSIDHAIESFEDFFRSDPDQMELEAKMEKLIDKEIKKRIARTTRSVLLKTAILVVALLFIINPIVKSFYPDFYTMANSEEKNKPLWTQVKNRYLSPLLYGKDRNYTSQYNDLANMVHSFYATSDPTRLLINLDVVDRQFGSYEFYLDTGNYYDGSVAGGDIDLEIIYKRGKKTLDYSKYGASINANLYGSFPDKKDLIEEVKKLPDSAYIFASVGSKNLISIANLLKDFDKNFDIRPFWLRVVDPASYDLIQKSPDGTDLTFSPGDPYDHYLELGINPSAHYQVKKKTLKDKVTGETYTDTDPKALYEDIDKLSKDQLRKKLKKVYMANLDLIDKNRDIFVAFKEIVTTRSRMDQTSIAIGSLSNFTGKKDTYEYGKVIPDDFDIYKRDIGKQDDLKTNLFTIYLSKDQFLKLLNEDWVFSANVINCKFSNFTSK